MINVLKKLFTPVILETLGEYEVKKLGKSIYITTGKLTQTGGIIKELWSPVLKKIKPKPKSTWLILGLASGTVAKLISDLYKPSHITGVEIDKNMLYLAKKYLGLNELPGITIINADAKNYIGQLRVKLDYILVDVYTKDTMPAFVYEDSFLKKLSLIGHTVIINHLFYEDSKRALTESLIQKVSNHFQSVILKRSLTNMFIICYQPRKPI